jgi:hypothetical protein
MHDDIFLIFVKFTGEVMIDIVREFLQFFELDYTLSVFQAEAQVVHIYKYILCSSPIFLLTPFPDLFKNRFRFK